MADTVVLGGNGFLGSYLVDALADVGHRVTAFDRFSSPEPAYTAVGVRRVTGTISDPGAVREALTGQEVAFHFVGSTTPASSLTDPLAEVQTEVASAVPFLEAAADAGVARVVFASTGGAIYGDTADHDAISEDVPPSPISPYGIGKLAVEGFLRYFALARGIDTISLRIANPYGARQRPERRQGLIPIVLRSIAADRAIPVIGGGTMVRDYVYAPDVVRQVARLADADHAHPVYNVGSGIGTSITRVLALAAEVTGREVRIDERPAVRGYVERSVLDVSRFDGEFGTTAVVGLRDGIQLTWNELEAER